MKRKHGLLKKAAELSILCGLKVNLVFSDIQANIFHIFSNDCNYKIDYEQFLRDNIIKDESTFMEYSIFDYPFENISSHESKVTIIPEFTKDDLKKADENPYLRERGKKDNLKKRDPKKADVGQPTSKLQVPVVLTFDLDKQENAFQQRQKLQASNLEKYRQDLDSMNYKFIGMEGITVHQASSVEEFLKDLDQRITSNLNLTETGEKMGCSFPNFFMAKELIQAYFGFSQTPRLHDNQLRDLLRLHIDTASMISALGNIRDSTSSEPYETKITRFCDVVVGLVIKPNHFKAHDLATLRPGKPITLLLSFFIKSVLQQIEIFDGLYAGTDSRVGARESQSLIHSYNRKYVEQLISTFFNLIACQRINQSSPEPKTPTLIQLGKSAADAQDPRKSAELGHQFNFFEAPQEKFYERASKVGLIKCTLIAW